MTLPSVVRCRAENRGEVEVRHGAGREHGFPAPRRFDSFLPYHFYKRIIMADATKGIHESLREIQLQLKAPKSQYNSFGKYAYRSAEDILESVKPLLAATNCTLTLSDEAMLIGQRYYIKAIAVLSNGKNEIVTTAYAREEETKKGMDGSQITGTASSYARKYALNGLFAIDDNKDSDYLNTGNQRQQETPQKRDEDIVKKLDAIAPNFYSDLVQAVAENPEAKWTFQDGTQARPRDIFLSYDPTIEEVAQFDNAVAKHRELFVHN